MCVVSMVMEHKCDCWRGKYWNTSDVVPNTLPYPLPERPEQVPLPTPEEIEEFRQLLKRARKYDEENNEPDCENEGKKILLLEMANKLGVDISFVNE